MSLPIARVDDCPWSVDVLFTQDLPVEMAAITFTSAAILLLDVNLISWSIIRLNTHRSVYPGESWSASKCYTAYKSSAAHRLYIDIGGRHLLPVTPTLVTLIVLRPAPCYAGYIRLSGAPKQRWPVWLTPLCSILWGTDLHDIARDGSYVSLWTGFMGNL